MAQCAHKSKGRTRPMALVSASARLSEKTARGLQLSRPGTSVERICEHGTQCCDHAVICVSYTHSGRTKGLRKTRYGRKQTMFRHILVPLDGSLRAELALPVAVRLARTAGGSLTLCV